MEYLQKLVENTGRYHGFTLLDTPKPFREVFKDQNVELIQLHSITKIDEDENGVPQVIGFVGVCKWEDNKLSPLDGDSYCEDMTIYGYNWFSNEKTDHKKCLDILVDDDW